MDTVVLDIETKHTLAQVGRDRKKFPLLGVSLVGVYSYGRGEFVAFREDQMSDLEGFLSEVKQIVGFNLYGFDYPVLEGHLDFDFSQVETVDIMDEIKRVISRRVGLNAVAGATLGAQKSADGLKAIQFYHQGEWEKLEKYCLDDVRITRDVFDYGRKKRYVKIPANYGTTEKSIPVQWQLASDKKSLSLTSRSQGRLL